MADETKTIAQINVATRKEDKDWKTKAGRLGDNWLGHRVTGRKGDWENGRQGDWEKGRQEKVTSRATYRNLAGFADVVFGTFAVEIPGVNGGADPALLTRVVRVASVLRGQASEIKLIKLNKIQMNYIKIVLRGQTPEI